jgi:8-oxo-dGTP pyrophosphatase MutT (NUDIX family)
MEEALVTVWQDRGMSTPPRFSVIVLVDSRGRLLLQERDEHAPIAPDKWSLVGGHVDDDEEFEPAAYRELAEETGIRWTSGLTLAFDGVLPLEASEAGGHFTLWVAATDLTDDDIMLGEGRQIVFIDPADIPGLDLAHTAAALLPSFLASNHYAELAGAQ